MLAFVGQPATREVVVRALHAMNLPAKLVHDGGIGTALSRLDPDESPQRLIVDVSDSGSPVDDIVALTTVIDPETRITAIGTLNDVTLFRQLLAAGVSDYLVKPVDPKALDDALNAPIGRTGAKVDGKTRQGRVAVFIGARGGLGASTIATNVAYLAAHERARRVGLVDLDLQFGTVALALDLEPTGGLREALEQPGRIDSLFIDRAMVKRGERLFVLGAEEGLENHLVFDPNGIATLMRELMSKFQLTVIDLPRHGTAFYHSVLSCANDVFVLSDLSLAGIRDAIRLETLVKRHCPTARIRFLACTPQNPRAGAVSIAAFEKGIGRKVSRVIPFDPKAAAASSNVGKPLSEIAAKSPLVKAIREIAVELSAVEKKSSKTEAVPFWRRWIQ